MGEVLERVIFLGGETKKGHTFSSACIIILCIFLIILEENLDNKIIDKMKKEGRPFRNIMLFGYIFAILMPLFIF